MIFSYFPTEKNGTFSTNFETWVQYKYKTDGNNQVISVTQFVYLKYFSLNRLSRKLLGSALDLKSSIYRDNQMFI